MLLPRRCLAIALGASLLAPACRPRESLQATRDRAAEASLLAQIADLQKLVAKGEAGQLYSEERIAIGLAEQTSKALLDVSLPQEMVLGERLRVRVESAQPFFRGNNAILVFQATAQDIKSSAEARLELGGRMTNFRIEKGKLRSGIELVHFKVIDSSLGDMGSDVLENIVRGNMDTLSSLLPGLEIPVQLEESIQIAGLREGVVAVKPGALPLKMALADVLPVAERLWILLDVKAGPWETGAPPVEKAE